MYICMHVYELSKGEREREGQREKERRKDIDRASGWVGFSEALS